MGVFNPARYRRRRGTSRSGSKCTVELTKGGHTAMKKILTLQEYRGDRLTTKNEEEVTSLRYLSPVGALICKKRNPQLFQAIHINTFGRF